SVNGSEPLPFILDTGSSPPFLLDRGMADKLKIKGNGTTVTNGDFKVEEAAVESMQLVGKTGNANLAVKSVYLGDTSILQQVLGEGKVAGIVGMPFFAQMTARIDFAARLLTIFIAPNKPLTIPGATAVELTQEDDGLCLAPIALEGAP